MTVVQTSLFAYRDPIVQLDRETLRGKIYDYVREHPNCTQPEFCEKYGLLPHKASGRFSDMEDDGLIIKTGFRNEERRRGRKCYTYAVAEASL